MLTTFFRHLTACRFGLLILHRARTAAAVSATIRRAFLAARLHRTRARFTAAIGFVAARFGRIIFSRHSLPRFIFQRAIVFYRAVRNQEL